PSCSRRSPPPPRPTSSARTLEGRRRFPGSARHRRAREVRLEEERIFAGVEVVPLPQAHLPEPEGLVEAPGLDVAGSDLQDDARRPATAVVLQERAEEVAGDALAAPGRVDGEVGHVDLAR